MLNIMRADIYRIFRGKGMYITLGLLLGLIVLQVVTGSIGHVGVIGSEADNAFMDTNQLFTGRVATLGLMGSADTLLYFILPFIIFVADTDFSSGTAKNVLSNGMPRNKYYLSKLILSCIICVIIMSINVIVPFIIGTVLNGLGAEFNIEFVASILKPFFAQLLLCLSVTSIGVFFVFVTKRTAAVNGAYIAFCLVPMMILFFLTLTFPNLSFLMNYDIVTNIRMLAAIDRLTATEITRALLISGFYIVASTLGGIALFKKSEIK